MTSLPVPNQGVNNWTRALLTSISYLHIEEIKHVLLSMEMRGPELTTDKLNIIIH